MLIGAGVAIAAVTAAVRMSPTASVAPSTTGTDTMRIHFERTGGLGGMRLAVTLTTDTLAADEVQALRALIDAAEFFDLPAELTSATPAPDEFEYLVTVETAARQHTRADDRQRRPRVAAAAARPAEPHGTPGPAVRNGNYGWRDLQSLAGLPD